MRSILITLMLLFPAAANAASTEESYFATRDAYIDKLKPTEINVDVDERVLKQEQAAREDLERQLRRIVGTVEIKGFAGPGKSNLETLFKGDQGFGLLDGLLYSSADDKTHIVVSTDALLDHWLKEHKDWWGGTVANVPQEVGAVFKSEAFYTQVLQTDAAVFKYAELPVAKPGAAKLASAMLVARAQDLGPRTPDELIVAVLQGGRVFVVTAPASARIEPMPACERIWQEAVRKSTAAQEAYAKSEPKDEKLAEQSTRLEEEGDAAFRRCFAERATSHASFAMLTQQAQVLVDRFPVK
jgi:hypothetical protein